MSQDKGFQVGDEVRIKTLTELEGCGAYATCDFHGEPSLSLVNGQIILLPKEMKYLGMKGVIKDNFNLNTHLELNGTRYSLGASKEAHFSIQMEDGQLLKFIPSFAVVKL